MEITAYKPSGLLVHKSPIGKQKLVIKALLDKIFQKFFKIFEWKCEV